MSLYNILDKNILLPLGDIIYGSCVSKRLKELQQTDMITEYDLMSLQNAKLQRLVKHCYNSVPYYKRIFDERGILPEDIKCREDLKILPILTKQIIRENYDTLFSSSIKPSHRRPSSTGGSTGTPLKFCTDAKEWSSWKASTLRAWSWYGINLGDKIFSLGGNSINQKKNILSYKGMYDRFIMRNYKFSSANVSDEHMQKNYEEFMNLNPQVMRGYGSSLYIFARYIERKRYPVVKLKAILTTGEVLMPEYRRKLEEIFNAPVYDAYGAGDGGILSHECIERNGLHITEESCIIEITDKNGVPLSDGQVGFVCTTDLDNYAFPFLRYHVGDMAYIKSEKCSCGRSSRVIGEVIGRAGKLVYNKQGVPLSPTMLPFMLYPNLDYHNEANQLLYNKIDRFQIRQNAKGNIDVLVKLKDETEEKSQFDYILDNFRKHFVESEIQLKFVYDIPCLPSGKDDYCVSEFKYE